MEEAGGRREAQSGSPGPFEEGLVQPVEKTDALIEIIKMLAGRVELDELLSLLATKTSEMMSAERSTIYLVDDSGQELWSKVAQGLGSLEIRLRLGQGLAGHAWKTGRSIIVDDVYADAHFDPQFDGLTGWKTRDAIVAPMRDHGDRITGVFEVLNHRTGHFTEKDEALLAGLSSAAAVALESARLRAQATYDFLTGLRNRRGFQELYEKELTKAKRHWRPMAVIMLDVDGLKATNDQHGHAVGDEVLKAVARLMQQSFRTTDVLARYGGDEFVALLPETDEQGASACVARFREMLGRYNQLRSLPVPVTVSTGIAAASSNHEHLMEIADQAMYSHKGAVG